MRIEESTFQALPEHLKRLFVKLPNHGSDEVVALFPVTTSGGGQRNGAAVGGVYGDYKGGDAPRAFEASSGSAARFFYAAKVSKSERNEGLPLGMSNTHPTLKPVSLMAYLCRLVTPPGGVVLDPFMGSGSTGKAAMREGFRFIGCELSAEYLAIARARIDHEIVRVTAANASLNTPQSDLFAEAA